MAFNGLGNYWLAPGAWIAIDIARGGQVPGEPEWGGYDYGAQWIMADPNTGSIAPGAFLVKDHIKEKRPLRGHPGNPAPIVYAVTVVNVGANHASFSLQGGGNV
jgi:hypothetical protein